jgi:hypothetical protein
MKASYLFLAALVVSAIGVPIETFTGDQNMTQQMMPAAAQLPIEGELHALQVRRTVDS